MPSVVTAGVPMRTPLVYQAPFGSAGIELRLVTMPASSNTFSAWRPVRPNDVATSMSTRWLSVPPLTSATSRFTRLSARARRVRDDLRGVGLEARPESLGEGDGLGRHDLRHGAAEHHRASLVDVLAELVGAQHHAATRTAQRLVGRGRDDVGVGHRVVDAGEHLACDEPGEVGHVDQQRRSDLVGDLAHPREVDQPGVGRVAGDDDEGAELAGQGGDHVVVDEARDRVDAVGPLMEHLPRDVRPEPVRQVTAGVERHADHALITEAVSQRLPVVLGQVVDVLGAVLGERGRLDAGGQDRPVGDEVRVDAGVRLDVGMIGTEQRCRV